MASPIATVPDVIALGFDAQQFGQNADFTSEDAGFVFDILADVAIEVRVVVGATTYDSADASGTDDLKLLFKRIKTAETYLAGAELWRRIEAYERRNRVVGREGSGTETISSRALKNAEEYEARGWAEVERITGVEREGGSSFGYVETGHYDEVGS